LPKDDQHYITLHGEKGIKKKKKTTNKNKKNNFCVKNSAASKEQLVVDSITRAFLFFGFH